MLTDAVGWSQRKQLADDAARFIVVTESDADGTAVPLAYTHFRFEHEGVRTCPLPFGMHIANAVRRPWPA